MRIRKSHIILFLSFIVIVTVAVAVQYYHFRGVKDSLEHLIEQKTKGQYKLDLGETSYDFIKLDFTLKDARVYRIDTVNNTRVYSVELPYVRINLGSLESYFDFGQINVKEFVIREPVIVLRKEKLEKQRLRLSAELSNLLHIVKEILDSFNVHSFKVVRGSFTLSKGDQTIRIRLIDFLAKEWNVRKLTGQSQVEITIGPQKMNVFAHDLSFGQIEYSYLKRQLTLSDFSYHHHDSITGARLDAKGKAFIVYHMDWEELSSTERYKLKKIELISPDISGAFPLIRNKKEAGDFSKILHDAVGEMIIDSLTVRDARVHLAYKQIEDSTSVSFKDASFSVTDFKLLNSKESFEVGEVRFNLNQTELTIGKKYIVRFDSLFFNHYLQRRLYVEGLQIAERGAKKPFLISRQVIINHFNAFDFLMDKSIKAESLELNEVILHIFPDQFTTKNKPSEKSKMKIDLNRFNLSHATVYFTDGSKKAIAKNLNIGVRGIHVGKKGKPLYDFDRLSLKLLQYADEKEQVNVDVHSVSVKDNKVTARLAEARQAKGLTVLVYRASVSLDSLTGRLPDHLSFVHAEKMQLSGTPVVSAKKRPFPRFSLDHLVVDTMSVAVMVNTNSIHLHAFNFILDGIHLDSTSSGWKQVQTELKDFLFENKEWLITGKNSRIDSRSRSSLHQLRLFSKDSTVDVQTAALAVRPFSDYRHLPHVSVVNSRIKIHTKAVFMEGVIDSIALRDLRLESDQKIRALHVYHPVVRISPSAQENKERKPFYLQLPKPLGEAFIHNAQVTVNSTASPLLIYNLDAQWKQEGSPFIYIDSLVKNTKQAKIAARKVMLKQHELLSGSISMTPLQDMEIYSQTGYERDWLKMNFDEVKAKGFVLDSLLYGKKLKLDEVSIGAFQIDVLRDKRLPDGAFKEKELFSRKINSIARSLEIPGIRFSNGAVTVQQISDKTQEKGVLVIDGITGEIKNVITPLRLDKRLQLDATAKVFGQGLIKINYRIEEEDRFQLEVEATDIDLKAFNRIIQPLQSVRFKSGQLKTLKIKAAANDVQASGNALINYQDLRIEILKADKTNLRNELVSAIANEIIKNKRNAESELVQERDKGKAEFTYWVKIIMKGASGAARHGKKKKDKPTS